MLHVSALSFQRATRNPADRQIHTYTDTQTDYRMPRGSAHRGIIITLIWSMYTIITVRRGYTLLAWDNGGCHGTGSNWDPIIN